MHNWEMSVLLSPCFQARNKPCNVVPFKRGKFQQISLECNSAFPLATRGAYLMCFCWISHYAPFANLSNEKEVLKWGLIKYRCVYLLYKLTLKKLVLFLSQKRPCAGMCFSCCQGTPLPSSTSRAHCRFCGQNGAGELRGGDKIATTGRCTKLACFYLLTCNVTSHFPGSCCSDSVCRGM